MREWRERKIERDEGGVTRLAEMRCDVVEGTWGRGRVVGLWGGGEEVNQKRDVI